MINKYKVLNGIQLSILLIMILILAGCKSMPSHWHKSVDKEIGNVLEESAEIVAHEIDVPPEVSQSMLLPMDLKVPEVEQAPIEPHFDLSANKTPAREVFMSLVKDTPYSMVVNPGLDGTISLQLKNVTVEEALRALQQVYGYAYRREGNRYFIMGRGIQTRIFSVNYLNFNRKGSSDVRVSSSELTQAGSSNSDDNGGGTTSSQTHGVQVKTDSESDFWKELVLSLETILGEEDGRRVVANSQAGLIIVRAMPAELATVEKFLGVTQTSVNRQVILEAKIIEVELKDAFQTGINWSALGTPGSSSILASQIGGGTVLNSGASEIAGFSGNLQPDGTYDPITSAVTSAFGGVFSLNIKAKNFSTFFELLQGQGDVHVLSSPRISTVNNQRAVIKVGGDEFFVTGITNSTVSSGATTTEAPEVELTPFFSGIALDVTPQIDEKDNVILHIHPTVSSVSQEDKQFLISGKLFSLPLAISNIQESDNVVRAESGQVIVIGGLMKEISMESNASIPFLGDIPVLGHLFKHQRFTRVKKELVILLKPTVVDHNKLWGDSIKSSQKLFDEITSIRDQEAMFKREQ